MTGAKERELAEMCDLSFGVVSTIRDSFATLGVLFLSCGSFDL